MANENATQVVTTEAEQVARAVRTWLNGYTSKPCTMVDVEHLGKTGGLALVTIQAAYKTHQYLYGGYKAQYQFAILYRTIPTTANERLTADEVLNNMAAWAETSAPTLPETCILQKVYRNSNAALLYAYDDGAEDHQILMTIEYEVF